MRINAIGLFNDAGEPRVLRLKPGLNVITGWFATGKSSVLEILDYCLGRIHPSYPVGALTRSVRWFAVEVEHDGSRLTIARPVVENLEASSHSAAIFLGSSIDDLRPGDLTANSDAGAVRAALTTMLGIEMTEVRPAGAIRPPLVASASQALLLNFQGQSEIGDRLHLYHRSSDPEVADALRSTLPYFIGAIDADTLRLKGDLEAKQRELRVTEARLARARLSADRTVPGASQLLATALAVGLTEVDVADNEDTVSRLRAIRDLPSPADRPQPPGRDATLDPLIVHQHELVEHLALVEHRLGVLRRASAARGDYVGELTEQRSRLVAIGLVDDLDSARSHDCPICGQSVEDDRDLLSAISSQLVELDQQLEAAGSISPSANARRDELSAQATGIRRELAELGRDIDAVRQATSSGREDLELRRTQAFTRGRIVEFLAAIPPDDDPVGDLERAAERLAADVDRLSDTLGQGTVRETTASLMRVISAAASAWALQLGLEHSENGIQLDADSLSLVADTRDGPVPLARMGSAAMIIGYHLVAHLALHKWFVEQDRPVPNFLVLDQPSQAFYQADALPAEGDLDLADEDRERLVAFYTVIRDAVDDTNQELQVIVLDHANLNLDWFQSAVVANWRGGDALVPHTWLEDSTPQT
jgi:Protein of unknown function (DUF3732)